MMQLRIYRVSALGFVTFLLLTGRAAASHHTIPILAQRMGPGRLASTTQDRLVESLRSAETSVRADAANRLSAYPDRRTVSSLMSAVNDPQVLVRNAARRSLNTLGGRTTRASLEQYLRDTDVQVRRFAAGVICDGPQRMMVWETTECLSDSDPVVRDCLLRAMLKSMTRSTPIDRDTLIRLCALTRADDLPTRNQAQTVLNHASRWLGEEQLTRFLQEQDAGLRRFSAGALVEHGIFSDGRALVRYLGDEDLQVRDNMAKAFVKAGRRIVPTLLEQLPSAPDPLRLMIIGVLGAVRDPSAMKDLLGLAGHEDAVVRQAANEAIGKLGGVGNDMLLSLLEKGSDRERSVAAGILVGRADEQLARRVAALKESASPQMRTTVMGMLGQWNYPWTVDLLIDGLGDESADVVGAAHEMLVRQGPRASHAIMDRLAGADLFIREELIEILIAIRTEAPGAWPAQLSSPQWHMRETAARLLTARGWKAPDAHTAIAYGFACGDTASLQRCGAPAVAYLRTHLREQDEDIRRRAAALYGGLAGELAVPDLLLLIDDTSRVVRDTVCGELARILSDQPQTMTAAPASAVKSVLSYRDGHWSLEVNGRTWSSKVGIVYQNVPAGRHINDIRSSMYPAYRALLDTGDGGDAHARRLYEMGIRSIRVYELPVDNPVGIKRVKQIFRAVHAKYGFRFLIGDYAGLYDHSGQNMTDRAEAVRRRLSKLVELYGREPWVLAWQLGNEGNYHVRGGRLTTWIDLSLEEYFRWMDELALFFKERLRAHRLEQFVILGNGELGDRDVAHLEQLKYFDGVGLNVYRDNRGLVRLTDTIGARLSRPVILSEIGLPAAGSRQERAQNAYLTSSLDIIEQSAAASGSRSNIVQAYICEATDQAWKAVDLGEVQQAHLGILGKAAERGLAAWTAAANERWTAAGKTPDKSFSLNAAWTALRSGRHEEAVKIADRLILWYSPLAKEQQKRADAAGRKRRTDTHNDFWALDDVGTAWFIRIEAAHSREDIAQALAAYDVLKTHYRRAIFRGHDGRNYTVVQSVRKRFPDLFPRYIFRTWREIFAGALASVAVIVAADLLRRAVDAARRVKREVRARAMSVRKRLTLLGLLFLNSCLLFELAGWWFHPIRMEFYIVQPIMFTVLSAIGCFFFGYNLLIYYLLWSIAKPQFRHPESPYRVAMVTTYIAGEPLPLVKDTLGKIQSVRYRHDTFVMDESDSEDLRQFCLRGGITHFSRKNVPRYQKPKPPFQRNTKGGNLNAWWDAFGKHYDIVVFFDSDHQPRPEYLDRVLGYFDCAEVGYVQAPHIFHNDADSWIARGACEQNYYFAGPVQMGLYGNDVPMVNGSHSIFRVRALDSIGGYAVHNADDILTTLRLNAKGWRGVYVNEVLAVGLTPAEWGPLLLQQYRWAHSMFDLLFYQIPRYALRLKFRQLGGYVLVGSFYLMAINLTVLMLLPVISVWTNSALVNLMLGDFLIRFLPVYVLQIGILIGWGQTFLARPEKERGIWWRSGYVEIAGCIYVARAFFKALFRGQLLRTRFVTPKDSQGNVSYLKFFIPHMALAVISGVTFLHLVHNEPVLWQTQGMKWFLAMVSLTMSGLAFSSTTMFSRIAKRFRRHRKGRNTTHR